MKFSKLIAGVAAVILSGFASTPALAGEIVPGDLLREVIAQSESESGQIAAVALNDSGTFLVYLKSEGTCGTGGCSAEIWQKTESGYQMTGDLPASFLPLRELPMQNGKMQIGITIHEKAGRAQIVRVSETDDGYEADWNHALARDAGKPLISQDMLSSF